jgi:uncharacterized protein YjbJ (UPF0337 family)
VSEKREPGAMEKAKGMAREAAGKVIGDEEMKAEGRAERGEERSTSEGHPTEGNREYFRKLIEKTNERSGL